ncbi:MAG: hypothetical protein BIFFINMI_03509 [Phycisphaerae bacterium]|nr:hypothetical protein [Phycisphaerae bacterium]
MNDRCRQISLVKGSQRYVFRYCEGDEPNVLDAFRTLAGRNESGFDWFDAAVLCFKMARRLERELDRENAASEPPAKAAG